MWHFYTQSTCDVTQFDSYKRSNKKRQPRAEFPQSAWGSHNNCTVTSTLQTEWFRVRSYCDALRKWRVSSWCRRWFPVPFCPSVIIFMAGIAWISWLAARLTCGSETNAYRDAFSVRRQYRSFARDTVAFLVGIVLYRSVLWRFLYLERGSGSSVGIATGHRLDGPGIESRWGRDLLHLSTPALGPNQPPVQWVPGLSRG